MQADECMENPSERTCWKVGNDGLSKNSNLDCFVFVTKISGTPCSYYIAYRPSDSLPPVKALMFMLPRNN